MSKLIIDENILKTWLTAKIELHSDHISAKEIKQIEEHERMNPCKYCTKYLIEQLEAVANWKERMHLTTDPCVNCGRMEQHYIFFSRAEKKI
jgi:RNase P subunit RPR2